jgi:hypothetical protein
MEGRMGQEMRSTANHNCIAQLSLAGLAWVAALALLPISVSASESADAQPLAVPGTGVTVYGPTYVLNNFVHTEGDGLVFTDKEGRPWALVEDTSSEVIANKGDGSFHPFDAADVADAVQAISYPLDVLDVEIYVLPYPRERLLDCSTGGDAIYLSPGVQEVPQAHAHMIVTHEMGHAVHNALMPDNHRDAWRRYRQMRNIDDMSVYSASAAHCNRPHEIFAEDFRYLFGGPLSNYSGTIENRHLMTPDNVPGLAEFMLSLSEVRFARAERPSPATDMDVSSYPNPFSNATTVSLKVGELMASKGYTSGATSAHAQVFDARGRAVKDLGRRSVSGGAYLQFRWDGTDGNGRKLPSGVYFLRVELAGGAGSSSHKMLLKR